MGQGAEIFCAGFSRGSKQEAAPVHLVEVFLEVAVIDGTLAEF